MDIIGWIRQGDQAACGGVVAEGDPTRSSHGRAFAYQGARMACRKNCVIAEGYLHATLANRRCQVLHGMATSAGCPLASTLNDVDGVGNGKREAIPVRFVQDGDGAWSGRMNEGHDRHFVLVDEHTGESLPVRHDRMGCNGEVVEGKTDADGRTGKPTSDDPAEVHIEIMPEGYEGADG
ncbi:PAAR domain-containing protein [Massilia niastensis]|uniref:PAAR domain-containing protein n=1 Tax=Massilia niastensis TaxID=544911 RepID=UPI00037F848C|nr:PAAR domain-containing protein [Massilia niastensis]